MNESHAGPSWTKYEPLFLKVAFKGSWCSGHIRSACGRPWVQIPVGPYVFMGETQRGNAAAPRKSENEAGKKDTDQKRDGQGCVWENSNMNCSAVQLTRKSSCRFFCFRNRVGWSIFLQVARGMWGQGRKKAWQWHINSPHALSGNSPRPPPYSPCSCQAEVVL